MYANMRNGGDGSGTEKIAKGGEMGVRVGAKEFVCGDEVGEKDLFAITLETWLMGAGKIWKREERGKRWWRSDSSRGWGWSSRWLS